MRWEKSDAGEVQITVTRQDNWRVKLLSRIFYIPKQRRITLDELGTQVWEMCNGRTTVAQMIEGLSTAHQLNRKEAEVSLLAYLKTLAQKRFIGFLVESPDRPRGHRPGRGKRRRS
ncbi:MAG: PqqD family protein [Candidatus Latescibacterota bacterium]